MEIIRLLPRQHPSVMYALEFVQAGAQIELPDRKLLGQVEGLASLLISSARETAICVGLYESADAAQNASGSLEQEIDASRSRVLPLIYGQQFPDGLTDEQRDEMRQELYIASVHLHRRERMARGELSNTYHQQMKLLHAKSFVYALDTIENSLDILVRDLPANEQLRLARDAFASAFPRIELLRNSAHHNEDRYRMKGRNNKDIIVTNSPHRIYAADLLDGNTYGATVEDGSLVWVEVSVNSVDKACTIVEAALNALPWNGPALPRD